MTVLKFKNYTVNKMFFQENTLFDKKIKKLNLNPVFNYTIIPTDDVNTKNLLFNVKIGDLESEDSPFYIDIVINGLFEYVPEENELELSMDDYLKENGIAILFPYARSIISTLTSQSNSSYPTIILPTINVPEVVRRSEKREESK
ncbi:protein-export chaperone SecB [Pseudolactococcus yaeyamensis]